MTMKTSALPPIPEEASTITPLAAFLAKHNLEAYTSKFTEVGYDDIEFLRYKAKESKANVLTILQSTIGMLQGHADKFIFYLLKEDTSAPPSVEESVPANKHFISFVVDRSGSMSSMGGEVVNGYNKFVTEQQNAKKESGEAWLHLTTFDDKVEVVHDATKLEDVPMAKPGDVFQPRGMTALLDAIGETILHTQEKVNRLGCKDVTVVILTDGQENSSKKWSREMVRDKIKEKETKDGWEFIFLAANQDAIQAGQQFGIKRDNAMTYTANGGGMECAFLSVAQNYHAKRSTGAKMLFAPDQRHASAMGCAKSMVQRGTR